MRQTKKHKIVLQKLLLHAVPAEPIPEAFYTIDAPQSFNFPIQSTFLQNIKIMQQYYPSQPNKFIPQGLPSEITKYNDTLLQLKRKSILIGKNKLSIEGITAFNYNQTYLVAALEDKSLDVYGSDLRLIKEINGVSEKAVRLLHVVNLPPKTFEGLILITSSGNDITAKRIQKSFFSGLTIKYSKEITKSKQPYVKFIQMPKELKKKYFAEDPSYKNCTILGCLSCTQITVIRINHGKITGEGFVDILYSKSHYNKYNLCSASWGEAMINSKDTDMKGVHPVFTYSFGKEFYLLAPVMNTMQVNNVVQVKFDWVESFPFKLDKDIIFCQYIKQNEVLLITEDSRIVIFYTGILEFFEREIESKDLDLITYQFRQIFRSKIIHTGNETEIVSYNSSFAYDFGSNEIYYLTEEKIGIFVYCNWTEICDILIQEGNYESTMNFLIALYHKANRFDLGFKHTPENFTQLSSYIQKIATQYIHTKFGKFSTRPEQQLIDNLSNRSTIDQILTPLQLLTTTRQYTFLFESAKTMMQQYIPQSVFYKALQPFISFGRVKYIPDDMLKHTLNYYVARQQFDVVEKLAIFFDLREIEKGIVIKCCLDNILVVSLANICTQGNQSEFVTPFVKFWGIAQDERKRGEIVNAQYFAMRALWYVKLCLQRSMSLKSYSYQKYGYMISILTSHFFTESMIKGLLQIRTQTTLESLSHYFSIENASIVNEFCKLKIPVAVKKLTWIDTRQGRQRLEMMLSAIEYYLEQVKDKRQLQSERIQDQQLFYLFLSKTILFKTIKFTHQKYIQILEFLIRYYTCIHLINYGADRVQGMQQPSQQQDQIKASEYINKILVLTMQEVNLTKSDLNQIFEISRLASLTELQAQIKYISGNYGQAIGIYLQGSYQAKMKVFIFIENSFKILKLENKKSQKRSLEKQVKEKISDLVQLNAESMTKVVQTFMPESQDELIQALSGQQQLQLGYLQGLIQSNSKVSEASLLIYIELMSKYKPNDLLQKLKKLPSFPIQQSKQICKMYQVYDCLEYMYQRMGNIQESVKISVLRINQILKNKGDQDPNDMHPYVKIQMILNNVIEVCIKNKSEQIWEELFDSTIDLYYKEKAIALKGSRDDSEIDLFYQINAKILYELLNHCTLDHCIYLIQEKYGKLDLGGKINKAFVQVLSNYGFNQNIMFSARDLNSASLSQLHQKQLQNHSKGYSVQQECEVCWQPIDRSKKCIGFYCGHSYHKQCIIPLKDQKQKDKDKGDRYCIKCLTGQQNQFQVHIFQHGAGNHRTKLKTMLDEIMLLKENSIVKFNKEQDKYKQDQEHKQHDKAVSSKLDRMKSYEQEKQLVDETSNKVRRQLEMNKKKKKKV